MWKKIQTKSISFTSLRNQTNGSESTLKFRRLLKEPPWLFESLEIWTYSLQVRTLTTEPPLPQSTHQKKKKKICWFFWSSSVSLLLQTWAAVWQTRLDCGPVRERSAICDRLLRRRSGVESYHLRRPSSVWLFRSRVGSHEGGVVEMDLVMNLCCYRRFIFIRIYWWFFGLVYLTLTGSAVFTEDIAALHTHPTFQVLYTNDDDDDYYYGL